MSLRSSRHEYGSAAKAALSRTGQATLTHHGAVCADAARAGDSTSPENFDGYRRACCKLTKDFARCSLSSAGLTAVRCRSNTERLCGLEPAARHAEANNTLAAGRRSRAPPQPAMNIREVVTRLRPQIIRLPNLCRASGRGVAA